MEIKTTINPKDLSLTPRLQSWAAELAACNLWGKKPEVKQEEVHPIDADTHGFFAALLSGGSGLNGRKSA